MIGCTAYTKVHTARLPFSKVHTTHRQHTCPLAADSPPSAGARATKAPAKRHTFKHLHSSSSGQGSCCTQKGSVCWPEDPNPQSQQPTRTAQQQAISTLAGAAVGMVSCPGRGLSTCALAPCLAATCNKPVKATAAHVRSRLRFTTAPANDPHSAAPPHQTLLRPASACMLGEPACPIGPSRAVQWPGPKRSTAALSWQ
jgi:hypothetical protein